MRNQELDSGSIPGPFGPLPLWKLTLMDLNTGLFGSAIASQIWHDDPEFLATNEWLSKSTISSGRGELIRTHRIPATFGLRAPQSTEAPQLALS
jgi:hypothetical protein